MELVLRVISAIDSEKNPIASGEESLFFKFVTLKGRIVLQLVLNLQQGNNEVIEWKAFKVQ